MIDSKTSTASAANPAAPVISTWSPAGAPSTASRTLSTSRVTMSPSPVVSNGTTFSAVVPSREIIGAGGDPAVAALVELLRSSAIVRLSAR